MKLELKHLAPYLPYGLKIYMEDLRSHVKPFFWTLNKETNINDLIDRQNKPILRPLSDLSKFIEINGEKFVPILELRCIEQGNWDEGEFIEDHTQIIDYGVRKRDSNCYWVEWNSQISGVESFSFKGRDFTRALIIDIKSIMGIEICAIKNQLMLFNKLHEWHFDTEGLIEKGLAIDINTLNK